MLLNHHKWSVRSHLTNMVREVGDKNASLNQDLNEEYMGVSSEGNMSFLGNITRGDNGH